MRRRELMLLAACTGMTRDSASAEAETARIGFVQTGLRQENQSLLDAYRDHLSALGWTDGRNIAILDRWAEERTERLPGIVKELIRSGVAVLVTAGTPATLAAKRANATVSIVLVGVDDPVALGVVESLAQPGGNATGLSLSSSELIAKQLQLLRELLPGLHRLAVIVRKDPGLEQKLQDVRSNAERMKIEVWLLEATTGTALELAFARLRVERCEAVYLASGPLGPAKTRPDHRARRAISTACTLFLPRLSGRRWIDVVRRRLRRPVPPRRGLRRQDPQRRKTRRVAGRAADQI
jgi:ABC-type uncharacterized transport system substrate-binding protein